MFTDKQIKKIGHNLGVSAKLTLITMHLKITLVRAIARNLAVVHNTPVQNVKWMGTTPPARSICWETAVHTPSIGLVILNLE
ncbi:hypothetical protein BMS3Bbin16_00663 [archaeon BMS3Bbin16]|nr:hypothetical protein BMS3Bbin16_00663 [archaeon BMS3Bbin16]